MIKETKKKLITVCALIVAGIVVPVMLVIFFFDALGRVYLSVAILAWFVFAELILRRYFKISLLP